MHRSLVALTLGLAWLAAAAAAGPVAVTGFSVSAGKGAEGRVKLGFDLSGSTAVTAFTLANPPRVVLDFPALAWPGGAPARIAVAGVEGLRLGQFEPGRSRMVVDLSAPMRVVSADVVAAPVGHRLDLELRPTDPETFARIAGRPEAARWQARRDPRPAPAGRIVVAIDAGHGGIDPGATGEGLVEKEIVLDVARRLSDRLADEPSLVPFLTREDDRFVPLAARIRLARKAGAHLFLSLHADSLEWGEATGVSVYTLSEEGTDAAADAFAERENRSDVLAGADLGGVADDVTRVLIDLAHRGTSAESIRLADALVTALASKVDVLDTRPHRRGNFYVLKAPDLPSVLVELGFLTSAEDRARLADPAWRDRVVERLVAGILAWTRTASPGFLGRRG